MQIGFSQPSSNKRTYHSFVKKSIEKPLDTLFWNPILTAQLSLDGDATSDRKLGNSYILFKVIRLNVQKAIVNIAKNGYSLLKNK